MQNYVFTLKYIGDPVMHRGIHQKPFDFEAVCREKARKGILVMLVYLFVHINFC